MTRTAKFTLLLSLVLLMILAGCGQEATEGPGEAAVPQQTATVAPEPTSTPQPTPTTAAVPTPAQAAPPPEEPAQPSPTSPAPTPPETQPADWAAFCQPSPKEEGVMVANLPLGSTVELDAYLYVKSFSNIRDNMMPFTLRGIPYQSGDSGWIDACQIHLQIPIGTGPNHVKELPDKFQMSQVVVWDGSGREISGWQRSLDSYHVKVRGLVVKAYGGDTGLDGSNTLRVEQIELLEG
jgi:hypothetical protein